ncbi:hypothetical protein [Streptomyces scabiei]|uniref:hypothetical protein n=1 Tax=Streptomyces scabiei TaxID=1930 RepID=UPI0029A50296|nr:hypothetical protein [Streptomyces scabiei]MDX3027513.1 hypothetical protein [Streptomyces scabiei]
MSTTTATPAAPLPSAAADALRSLELRVTAIRYRDAAEHCQALAAASDFDGCLAAQDEMAMCRCQLAAAGRLDLIGVFW